MISKWQKSIENNRMFRHSYTRTSVSLKSPEIYSNIQIIDTSITRLRLGFTKLPGSFGYHFKIYPTKLCDSCLVPVTAEHWILDCQKWVPERDKLQLALAGAGLRFNMSSVLRPPVAKQGGVYSALALYIVGCGAVGHV